NYELAKILFRIHRSVRLYVSLGVAFQSSVYERHLRPNREPMATASRNDEPVSLARHRSIDFGWSICAHFCQRFRRRRRAGGDQAWHHAGGSRLGSATDDVYSSTFSRQVDWILDARRLDRDDRDWRDCWRDLPVPPEANAYLACAPGSFAAAPRLRF